ncbi:Spc19 [Nakaseomyces glabratus]
MQSLEQCVNSLEAIVHQLDGSVSRLARNGEASNELCEGILKIKRVFELVPEYDVESARLALFEEVDPMVKTLGDKIEKALIRKRRELENLRQTSELNSLRLSGDLYFSETGIDNQDMDVSTDAIAIASATDAELDELRALKAQRAELQELLDGR